MCASPLSFLRTGPPPPKVALLPDAPLGLGAGHAPVDADAAARRAGPLGVGHGWLSGRHGASLKIDDDLY